MTSKPGPKVNVDDPAQGIIDSGKNNNGQKIINNPDTVTLTTFRTDNFEAIIRAVEANSQAGGEIPRLSGRFPFNRSKFLRKLLLGVDKYLFGRQRETNLLLARALSETVKFNTHLNNQIIQLVSLLNKQKESENAAEDEKRSLDALYAAFEDQFRGNREDIKERQRIYLPLVQRSLEETEGEAVDVGCGRGEWLELLREQGLRGLGVDTNHVVIKQCRERGLDIAENDAVSYLRSVSNGSLGAVTGFHIVEHLPFDILIRLLDETVRTLKTGGIAIFETPNPQNVLVGSNNFYFDPTHRNPIPSLTLKFLAEARGLCRVEIMELHPYPKSFMVSDSDLAVRFNEYFYGPQDYALIGYKS